MSFREYPGYRESGIDWLGLIPEHWTVIPLARISSEPGSLFIDGDWVESKDLASDGIRYITTGNIGEGKYKEQGSGYISQEKFDELRCTEVLPGDVLISRLNLPIGRACVVPDLGERIITSVDNVIARPDSGYSRSYLAYMLSSASHFANMENLARGTTMQRISRSALGKVRFAFPSHDEQEAISAFLDTEIGKIDALVDVQEKLIALLKEKRQAVISHAVTKGLDSGAPMKDSGIEWLGEVPAHWAVVPIKWLSPVLRGASPRPIDDPKYFDEGGAYSWVRIADVSASDGVLRETEQRLSDLGSSLSVRLEPGSLFVSIAGTVGKPCITEIKACIHDGFVYFPRLSIDPMFLFRIFEAGVCYLGLGKLGTQLNLNTDTIGSIRIAVPPRGEVAALLKFLDSELAKIDSLISEAVKGVVLLLERRSALISTTVTGKIDVRDLTAEDAA
jgi:type I restriction enzyme S subunit